MNNPQENVKKLPILKHFCITIGNLPSSYMESMSYEEMIIWLCKYLEDKVIPTLNNNGEAVTELQELYKATKEYIDSYFTNLDVQKEIDNKLDKMLNNGELEQIFNKLYNNIINEINSLNENLNDKINKVYSGAPSGIYKTKLELDNANPNHEKIYLVSDTGEWYYYDEENQSWTSGGIYQTPITLDNINELYNKYTNLEKIIYGKTIIRTNNQLSNGAYVSDTPIITNQNDKKYKCNIINIDELNNKNLLIDTKIPLGQSIMYFLNFFDKENIHKGQAWHNIQTTDDYLITTSDIENYRNMEITQICITLCFTTNSTTSGIVELPQDFTAELYTLDNKSLNKRIVIVDEKGNGNYTSVIEAVNKEPEDTVIIIKPGTYLGTIKSFQKRIILIGTDKNQCILRSTDGRYSNPAIEISCGYLKNLTIESKYIKGTSNEIDNETSGAYAVHCEHEYGVGKKLEINNCILQSDFESALGVGLRKDFTLIVNNCTLINNQELGRGKYSNEGGLGALYYHDSIGEQGNQYIEIKNCLLKSNLGYSLVPYKTSNNNNKVYNNFIFNVLYDKINKYTNNIWFRNNPFETDMFTKEICYGNSNEELNNI